MAHINDLILAATGGLTYNEGLSTYFGRTNEESLQDAERRFLLAEGATPGHTQDMWFELLRAAGFTGSLKDMWFAFWDAGGVLP